MGGDLLEVYTPIRSPEGKPLPFGRTTDMTRSMLQPKRRRTSSYRSLWVGSLLLALLQFPLAWRLSSRIQRDQAEKQRLARLRFHIGHRASSGSRLTSTMALSGDPTGVGYALAATATTFDPGDDRAVAVSDAADPPRNAVTALRSLLVEICPEFARRRNPERTRADYWQRSGTWD